MGSTNKTPNLHLNSWLDTDSPKRMDFQSDNDIIDEQLGGHILNEVIHLTAEEKEYLSSPVHMVSYTGNGSASRNVTLPFVPLFVIVFKNNSPISSISNSANIQSAGFALNGAGATAGLTLANTSLTVKQYSTLSTSSANYDFNASGASYRVILFK
ncbi:MAG: hypothetical protein LBM65_02040 [Oscillospiraceae bacterium]|jgi:hypothetical protein|nr:hypothetical protein [Oscillospiraceae bacterium]